MPAVTHKTNSPTALFRLRIRNPFRIRIDVHTPYGTTTSIPYNVRRHYTSQHYLLKRASNVRSR